MSSYERMVTYDAPFNVTKNLSVSHKLSATSRYAEMSTGEISVEVDRRTRARVREYGEDYQTAVREALNEDPELKKAYASY